MDDRRPKRAALVLAGLLLSAFGVVAQPNLAQGAHVTASGSLRNYVPARAVDGIVSDESRWVSGAKGEAWLQLDLARPAQIAVAHVFSGYEDGSAIKDFDLEQKTGDGWGLIPGARVRGNHDQRLVITFDQPVQTSAIRLVNRDTTEYARVREIALFGDASVAIGTGVTDRAGGNRPVIDRTRHVVAVNQVGYQTEWPKRFTAPLSPDGSRFLVRRVDGTEALFEGTIRGGLGDFSAFRPVDSATEYVVAVSGGGLKPGVSDPFAIRADLWREQFWQAAIDFMIDCRGVVGTHPSAYGGTPWRDGTYYDFAVPSLVLMCLADPARIEAMPRQIDWAADKARVLSPDFHFDAKNPHAQGVMEAVRAYYTRFEPPKPDAPDAVKLMHWGLGYYLMKPVNKDPSGDPEPWKIQGQVVEHFAWFVWAWPRLQLDRWLPRSFYDQCLRFAREHWESSGCFDVSPMWDPSTYLSVAELTGPNPTGGYLHPYKGRHPPGHSIVPNLLMYEVAKEKGLPRADRHLAAAKQHAQWLMEHLDWNDPRTTKGHRMSECQTVLNLVWFLQNHPDQAPAGLRDFIERWARVAVSRSDNLWDFRRFDLGEHWTIPKLNEPGNLAGFPACALPASWVVRDAALKQRLREIAVAQWDNLFGRNPMLASAASHPERGFPLVERGWPNPFRENVCARIELCRGALCASPGSEMYPFNPAGRFRHSEGWVNFNTAWNAGLAYFAWDARKHAP